MPGVRDELEYMRTVGRGSPVDRPWRLPGMLVSRLKHGRRYAPKDSRLGLPDVLASPMYRDLVRAKVAEGDLAPDFELPLRDGGGAVHLGALLRERPVALVFGSYT
ncbi:MAG TPA: hypothetical protein VFR43_09310 [Gaiellaceae bacterium]|jgi:hypothetical protein|nr:hypothetical protein [Gaiellaceae bacterium]